MGVTPTCWRPPFGDVDVRILFCRNVATLTILAVLQDRIRAIANALGLQTIIWGFDSNDWKAGTGNITTTDVDNAYNWLIGNETSGLFNTAGGIMLTHELNNYTMSEAINYYPRLKSSFAVRSTPHDQKSFATTLTLR
jgi:peptidoglycan/xylan/chitin deacetylase (PgdA/CDA1 family)